jgi:hypothetical protein
MLRHLLTVAVFMVAQTAMAAPIVSEYVGPAGYDFVTVRDITRDGRCAVGDAQSATDSVALRWCDGAVNIIPVLTTDGTYNNGSAISDDGKTVVGASGNGFGTLPRIAYKWTEAGGTIALPGIDGQTRSSAFYITPDGRYIAGQSRPSVPSSEGFRAIRWNNETPTKLDPLDQLSYQSVEGISNDGKTIVGVGQAGKFDERGFIWTEANGFQVLSPPTGSDLITVNTVSGDGKLIGGSLILSSLLSLDSDAALWSSDGSLLRTIHIDGLGLFFYNLTETGSMGLISTSSIGCEDPCPPPLPPSYFIYQTGLDLISFDSWFANIGGTFPADWSAIAPQKFSDTGEFLIGTATRGTTSVAWRADLRSGLVSVDEPQSVLVFFGGLGLLIHRRRRQQSL